MGAGPANTSVEESAAGAVLRPANVDEETGRPSRPMTTGESLSVVRAADVAAKESRATSGSRPSAPDDDRDRQDERGQHGADQRTERQAAAPVAGAAPGGAEDSADEVQEPLAAGGSVRGTVVHEGTSRDC